MPTARFVIIYRGFHEKGTFSVHSFNDDYLSIPERPGSYKYLFHEIPVTIILSRCSLNNGSELSNTLYQPRYAVLIGKFRILNF